MTVKARIETDRSLPLLLCYDTEMRPMTRQEMIWVRSVTALSSALLTAAVVILVVWGPDL